MKPSIHSQPLTDHEFDRLASFLDRLGSEAMNLEMLDGYFTALVCGPDMVLPSEYLPQVYGADMSFADAEQATDILGLLMRHWNAVAAELLRTLHEPHVYLPVLLEDEDGIAYGNDWSRGFMRGVQARPMSWRELLESEQHGGLLIPIMLFEHEHDTDPETRSPPIPLEKRTEMLETLVAHVALIYRYFEPHRWLAGPSPNHAPQRRSGPKVGRNDPCPCGSGRKYKHCCAAGSPTLH